jgi:hypothetical protein
MLVYSCDGTVRFCHSWKKTAETIKNNFQVKAKKRMITILVPKCNTLCLTTWSQHDINGNYRYYWSWCNLLSSQDRGSIFLWMCLHSSLPYWSIAMNHSSKWCLTRTSTTYAFVTRFLRSVFAWIPQSHFLSSCLFLHLSRFCHVLEKCEPFFIQLVSSQKIDWESHRWSDLIAHSDSRIRESMKVFKEFESTRVFCGTVLNLFAGLNNVLPRSLFFQQLHPIRHLLLACRHISHLFSLYI